MPKRLGIDVNVIDANGNALIEYGQQSDRRFKDRSRVSTFIEARNGVQFLIRLKVDNPFKFEEALDPVARLTAAVAKNRSPAQQAHSEHDTRTKHFDNNLPVEEEVKNLPSLSPATVTKVPFDLMVSIFIDGRAKPECRQMIYLDPKHPRYNPHCVLKGRWVDPGDASSRDGRAGLLQWVFSDRGIDHILEQLDVKKVIKEAPTNADVADLEDICEEMGEDVFENPEDRHMKAGQIEVRLRRVISIESDPVDQTFKAYHYAGSDEKPREIDDDCTHTTSFMPKTMPGKVPKIETFPLRHVAWKYYKKNEDFWASFIFYYMARYKLVNMRVSEPDGKPTLLSRTQRPEPDPSSRRGKKRASSFDTKEDEEQAWAERPVAKKAARPAIKSNDSGSGHNSDSSESEDETDNTAAFYHEQERGRYKLRATRVRLDNCEKAKAEDDADQIS